MAKFKFKANGSAEAGNFEPVPDGEYILGVHKVELVETKSGKPMLKLELLIDEGPYMGRKVWTNIVFNPEGEAGHGLTVQALKAFGFEYDGDLEIDTEDWLHRTAYAKLTSEPYEDKNGVQRMKNVIPTAGFITSSEPSSHEGSSAKSAEQPAAKPSAAAAKVFGKGQQKKETAPF